MNAAKNRIVGRITGIRTMALAAWLIAALPALAQPDFDYDFESLMLNQPLAGQDGWERTLTIYPSTGRVVQGSGVNPSLVARGLVPPNQVVQLQRPLPQPFHYTSTDTAVVWSCSGFVPNGNGHEAAAGLHFDPTIPPTPDYPNHLYPRTFGVYENSSGVAKTYIENREQGPSGTPFGDVLLSDNWYEFRLVVDFSVLGASATFSYRNLTLGETQFTTDSLLQNVNLFLTPDCFGRYTAYFAAIRPDNLGEVDNLHFDAPVSANTPPPYWAERCADGPGTRNAGAMVYDTARGMNVLFGGGRSPSTFLGDTWKWDGVAWNLASATGPQPRALPAMAYDSAREVTVLFGGAISNAVDTVNDTWEWNGATWTLVSSSGPAARYAHAMAYDTARQRVVMFGGNNGFNSYFGDTWEWDGSTWVQVSTTGPSVRGGMTMAYDAVRHRVVLFGGRIQPGPFFSDTWEWDGASWTQVATGGPSARTYALLAFDSARGRVVMFGGNSAGDPFTHLASYVPRLG